LRVALGLVGKATHKVILVTSLVEGEGKSFISNNFALSLSESSKRILLVDFDFRNPTTSNLFKAGNVPGVAEVLTKESDLASVIRRTAKANLFFISAGRNRKTGIEKLLEGECKSFFDAVKESFDVVIIDAPPMLPVADTRVIAPHCDATLFVMRHNVTPKNALYRLGKDRSTSKLKNPFIIFNGVKNRGYFNKHYGYGYAVNSKYPYKGQ
jgi:tyrosine-protein kinase Etk/Wzc